MNTRQLLMLGCLGAATGFAPPAHAAVLISGSSLYGMCTDYDSYTEPAKCMGYVEGIANVLASGDSVSGYKACLSSNADNKLLVEIVERYLDNAGNKARDAAATLVAGALAQSFPCKQ